MPAKVSTLIIPVENQVRELDAKLLLACVAAERGFPVVLGSRSFVNFAMPFLPRGVFLAKSLRAISRLMLDLIRGLGHRIVAWDEEGLVRYDSPEYYAWRYSHDTFANVDALFAWGADDAEFFAAYPGYGGAPVHVTGNPRIDLLRAGVRGYFNEQAAALKARYGDFILVNTNFSFVNNFVPALNLLEQDTRSGVLRVGRTGCGMSLEFARGMAAHQQAIHDHFRALMAQLPGWFPDRRIILRPHPSENHQTWRALVADMKQIEVRHEGSVVPWLMACRALLHNGCTTAVEASVLETPAVTYQPVVAASYDYHLPNGLSHCARSQEEVRQLLADILAGRRGLVAASERERLLGRHLAATTGALACDRVIDVLVADGYGESRPPRPPTAAFLKAWLVGNGRTVLKRINRYRRSHRNSAAYHDHRFPGISHAELNARIQRFASLLGRFAGVRAELRSQHLFRIVRSDGSAA